jgi:iron complex outermembrane recepter protein
MSAKRNVLLMLAVGLALKAGAGAAQNASNEDANSARPRQGAGGLEEVIVTARKRQESLQDVPVIVTALPRITLEQFATNDLFALKNLVPNLLMGTAAGSTGVQVSMRGIGTTTLNATMEQSVALNIDGLSLTQGLAYSAALFDVEQVEIMKGPQSLFFGKNNTAGVISMRSADPTDESEVITRVGYEIEAEEKRAELILSGPVSDSLKLRLATRYSDAEGWMENIADPFPGLGSRKPTFDAPSESLIIRGTALFEPSEAFRARLKLNYAKDEMQGGVPPLQVAHCPDGDAAIVPVKNIAFFQGDNCRADKYYGAAWLDPAFVPAGVPNKGIPFIETEQMFGTLDLNFELTDSLTLNSVTGYYDSSSPMLQQGSTTARAMPYALDLQFDSQQFTQELRLTSNLQDSPLNFMVGAFYQDGKQSNALRVPTNSTMGLPAILQHVEHEVDIKSMSIFGQAIWDISERVELAAGARWTDEEREHREVNLNPGNGPVGPVDRIDPKLDSSNVSPEVTVKFKASESLTAWAAYKTGFKSGSFSSVNFIPAGTPASFDDEEAKGGEAGLKFESPDGQLRANIAAYLYDYTDLQVGAMDLQSAAGGTGVTWALRTINAASAEVKGIEFDANYSPSAVEGLRLNVALNYNEARYDDFDNAPCGNGQTAAAGCNQILNPTTGRYVAQDLTGQRLVRAPDWTGVLGMSYDMALGNGLSMLFGANGNYTSEYSTTLVDLPGFEQDAATKFDANVALRGRDNVWELALIGRNLTDEITLGWCVNSNVANGTVFGGQISGGETNGPAGNDEASCSVDRGREIWARFEYRF